MNESSDGDFSFLLWLLSAAVAVLAAYLTQGWIRRAQRGPTVTSQWRAVLLAAGVLGTGLCATMVLRMQAAALPFPVGYQAWATAGLWLLAMAACIPVVAAPAASVRWWSLFASGAVLAVLAAPVQAGWIWAAGFRPGVVWRVDLLAGAVAGMAVGLAIASWVVHSETGQSSDRRLLWRLGGALLTGLVLMAGQELVMWAADLPTQQGSVYQQQVPGVLLSLVCGVLVPLLLAAMLLDLWMRRSLRNRSTRGFNPQKRRRRRYRSRHL